GGGRSRGGRSDGDRRNEQAAEGEPDDESCATCHEVSEPAPPGLQPVCAMPPPRTKFWAVGGDREVAVSDGLERRLTLTDAVSMVVGIILGSGIFMAPSALATVAPTPWAGALMWLVGGLIAACGAMTYAECGARLPHDGGFVVFFERAWSQRWAFVGGWAALFITYPASLAGVSVVGAHYLGEAVPALAPHPTPCALAMLTGAATLNLFGVRLGSLAQRLLTGTKVGAVVAVVLAALWMRPGDAAPLGAAAALPPATPGMWLAAFAVLMWTYDGWTDVTLVAGELRDPGRNLGRAVVLGLGMLVTVYVLVQVAVLTLLPASVAAGADGVFAVAVRSALGPAAGQGLAWLVVVSTGGSVHGMLWVTSRLGYALAERGAIPRTFARLSPRFGTPTRAVLGAYGLAAVYASASTFTELVSFFSFAIWICYGATAVALLRLRAAGVGEPLVWRAPGGVLPPAVLLLAASIMTSLQIAQNPGRCALGVGLMGLAWLLQGTWRRSS
ncbi:MAG TPA: amino acid permease, partial [Myxococcota bacterium]|nr:amino acid permease [Myxococcota bacterium]